MSVAVKSWDVPRRLRDPLLGLGGLLMLALVAAFARHGSGARPSGWMLVHLASVVPAVPIGAIVLFRRKGGVTHKRLGWLWVALMLIAAISSFWVRELTGRLSPIHILSVITLISLPRSILAARQGRIQTHRRGMLIVYASLVIAGFFTLLPNRLLGGWLIG